MKLTPSAGLYALLLVVATAIDVNAQAGGAPNDVIASESMGRPAISRGLVFVCITPNHTNGVSTGYPARPANLTGL
jgi:hypothetical protein